MKIKVAKRDLEQAVQVPGFVVEQSGGISSHFLFRVRDGRLEVLGAGGAGRSGLGQRLFASAVVSGAQIEDDTGAMFTVEGWRLRQWLKAVGDVAVTLEFADALVRASSPRGTIKFQSLDPSKFPFWDDLLPETKKVATLPSARIHNVLLYIKPCIAPSSRENVRPDITLTESYDSAFYATDMNAVCMVQMKEPDGSHSMPDTNVRIHTDDIGAVISFLGARDLGEDTEVYTHDKFALFTRGTTSFGVTRPTPSFPKVNLTIEADPAWFTLSTEDFKSAILLLSASAKDKDDPRVKFWWDNLKKKVVLSVISASGSDDKIALDVVDFGGDEKALDREFQIPAVYPLKIAGQFDEETLRFGIKPLKGKAGMTTFKHEVGSTVFFTAVAWKLD